MLNDRKQPAADAAASIAKPKQERGFNNKIDAAVRLYKAETGQDLPMNLLEPREVLDELQPYFVKLNLPARGRGDRFFAGLRHD